MMKRAYIVFCLFPPRSLIACYPEHGHKQFIQSLVRKLGSSFCDRGRLNISRYLRDVVFSWKAGKALNMERLLKINIP